MDIGHLIDRAGLDAEILAEKIGKSSTTVRNWVTGRTIPTLTPQEYLEILLVLNCEPRQLAEAVKETQARGILRRKPGRKRK